MLLEKNDDPPHRPRAHFVHKRFSLPMKRRKFVEAEKRSCCNEYRCLETQKPP